jgi:uncharacterized membrane protein YccF (DUF307 family)
MAHKIREASAPIGTIGIPFAWSHLKLAGLALSPIGKMIVPLDALPAGSGHSAWG